MSDQTTTDPYLLDKTTLMAELRSRSTKRVGGLSTSKHREAGIMSEAVAMMMDIPTLTDRRYRADLPFFAEYIMQCAEQKGRMNWPMIQTAVQAWREVMGEKGLEMFKDGKRPDERDLLGVILLNCKRNALTAEAKVEIITKAVEDYFNNIHPDWKEDE